MNRPGPRILFVLVLAIASRPASSPGFAAAVDGPETAISFERMADGIVCHLPTGYLQLQVCSDHIVRVAFARQPDRLASDSLMLDPARPHGAPWSLEESPEALEIVTSRLRARVDRRTGAVRFLTPDGRVLAAEEPTGRSLEPATVQGEHTYHVRQAWSAQQGEALYGLGEQQLGLLNVAGYDLDLWQHNGTVAVPFLLSSRGYGLLWDNNSFTRFGDLRPLEPIPAAHLIDADGRPGALTGSYFGDGNFDHLVAQRRDARIDIRPLSEKSASPANADPAAAYAAEQIRVNSAIHPALQTAGPISVRWEGSIEAPVSGDYQFQAFSSGGIRLWIDGRLVMHHWRQGWLPWKDVARVRFEAGRRYPVRLEWIRDQTPSNLRLEWKTPAASPVTSLWSEVGERIDYFFIAGPTLDRVIAGYRELTGRAPMMPRWAFGLWQSRQRYETAQQSLDVVAEFRRRRIPFDVIVQDWLYWRPGTWGSHEFDPERFPDPQAWIDSLHGPLHAHLMISVWPKFHPGTKNFEALHSRGFLYQPNLDEDVRDWIGHPYTFYDAFNPEARRLYWSQIERELFRKGVDAWWLDGSEPDLLPVPTLDGTKAHLRPTAGGTGARVLNAYPLMNTSAVYLGQREARPDQRVIILTRSGFAGQQRYAGAIWSGDTSATWTALQKQVPAALGYALSGMPYWTMDVGGFSVPRRFSAPEAAPADVAEWRELNTRWFQFGAFTPILRVHGEYPRREMWEFGGEDDPAFRAQLKFDRLRYRLFPYIYSVAAGVTRENASFLRPMVLDYPDDRRAREITDQYFFGPAFLASPVMEYQARRRTVYLPAASGGWYDFWTGAHLEGGRTIEAAAPLDIMPLHLRAGAIVPLGPERQYIGETDSDPLTFLVYAGADGDFTLYEDDGLTYGYERGEFAVIPLHWDDAARTLEIGERQGHFPGMLEKRTIRVVWITPERAVPFSFDPEVDRTITYDGRAVAITPPTSRAE